MSDFVSVNDAAAEIGVSRATLWKWLRRHGLETFRVMGDRRTMLRRVDLERLRQPIRLETKKLVA